MENSNRIKALIVDDSPLVRDVLFDILSGDPEIEVVGSAADPFDAVKLIQKCIPDVITLDIEMPRMDGITFLRKIMRQHPIPVIVISSHTSGNQQLALKAFENGALYVLNKPETEDRKSFEEYTSRFREVVKMAAKHSSLQKKNLKIMQFHSDDQIYSNLKRYSAFIKQDPSVIAIGASAGGTIAIQTILTTIKGTPPPIVITQHMPAGFTKEFAKRLNELSSLNVIESQGGEYLVPGGVYIAPGDKHLAIKSSYGKLKTLVYEGELVNHHRPSVEILFSSVSQCCSHNTLAFLLTGMGRDGAHGLLKIKNNGGITFAQDKNSSLVYGMPAEAMRLGAAYSDIPLDHIGPLITSFANLDN
ncbi:MAG: chemotaxis response regulator protein-glutamate methylesterase [Bacteroidales bacterium]|nr:chemotaxis response regulator protein-glutamate methylesterase [Bacteroidales bacterium]